MKGEFRGYACCTFVVAVTLSGAIAGAQESNTKQDDSTSGALETVIVTAEKRAEPLQQTPLSIEAFTPATLSDQQIQSAAQLQSTVTGLVYGSSGGFATPYIRGVGSDIATVGAEPGVATYVDGVYMTNPVSINVDLGDVERVEVVKGPQGTLYGRNAVGGAINVITLTPTHVFEAQAGVGYGSHNEYEANGFVAGSLSDRVALGAYVNASARDPLVTNLSATRPAAVPAHKLDDSVRLKALLNPIDTLEVMLGLHYARTRDPDAWSFRQVEPNALGLLAGGHTSNLPLTIYNDYPSYQTTEMYDAVIRATLKLPFADLVSITGYQYFTAVQSTDYDGTDAPIIGFSIHPNFTHQTSEEMRLVSPARQTVKWILGAYYSDESSGGNFDLQPGTLLINEDPRLTTRSSAVYGQVTIPIVKRLNFTTGARYTHDLKTVKSSIGIQPTTVFSPLPSQSATFDSPTWKAAIDFQVGDQSMFYLSYSRGFQDGAFNAVDTGAPAVRPETLDAYELGTKNEFLNRRVRINADVFDYEIKDLQVQVNDNSGAPASFQNAGAASEQGAELLVETRPQQHLYLRLGINYLQSKYKNFRDYAGWAPDLAGGNDSTGVDVSGNSIVYAPKWSGSIGGEYDVPVGSLGTISGIAQYYYTTEFAFDPQHFATSPPYGVLNASINWNPTEALRISLWSRNLANRAYYTWSVASNFGLTVHDAPGRLYGIRANYMFR